MVKYGYKTVTAADSLNRYRLPLVSAGPLSDGSSRLIDARELHFVMGFKTVYSVWLTRVIERFSLEEGFDFVREERHVKGAIKRGYGYGGEYFLHPSVALQISLLSGGASRALGLNSLEG
mgnify:CR=1 FL=1